MGIFVDKTVEDSFRVAMDRHAVLSAKALAAAFSRTQLREAQRVPEDWNTVTAYLAPTFTGTAQQVVSRNPNRSGIAVYNFGTGTVFFQGTPFNNRQAKDILAGGSVMNIGLLIPGAQANINTTGPLYAAAAGSVQGKLAVMETVFAVSNQLPQQPAAWQRDRTTVVEKELMEFLR